MPPWYKDQWQICYKDNPHSTADSSGLAIWPPWHKDHLAIPKNLFSGEWEVYDWLSSYYVSLFSLRREKFQWKTTFALSLRWSLYQGSTVTQNAVFLLNWARDNWFTGPRKSLKAFLKSRGDGKKKNSLMPILFFESGVQTYMLEEKK